MPYAAQFVWTLVVCDGCGWELADKLIAGNQAHAKSKRRWQGGRHPYFGKKGVWRGLGRLGRTATASTGMQTFSTEDAENIGNDWFSFFFSVLWLGIIKATGGGVGKEGCRCDDDG